MSQTTGKSLFRMLVTLQSTQPNTSGDQLLPGWSFPMIFLFASIGIPMRTTMDNSTTVMVAAAMNKLTAQASSVVREIDPSDNLTYLRIRSRKKEILMAPGIIRI